MRQIEEELTPFGIIVNGREDEVFIAGGDYWKVDTSYR
jgi:hypothetical protein